MWPANVYSCLDLALVPKSVLTSAVKGSVSLAYGKRYISKIIYIKNQRDATWQYVY